MPRTNGATNQRVRAGGRVIEESTVGRPEGMARGAIHHHPLGLWSRLFSEWSHTHTGWSARTRGIERDPSSIRRQPRIADRPFGALEQLLLVSRVRIDERNRVQPRKPFDEDP